MKPNVEASAIACLASALELNGKIKEAERELNRALKVVPSDARVDRARYRQNLAGLVRKKGDLSEAMKLYSDILKEFGSIYGKDTPSKYIAATLVNMGAVYIQTADYRKAQEAMHRALGIFKNLYGEKPHPHIVAVNTALGNIYEARDKIPRAREYREKSLKMSYELYGKDASHPRIVSQLQAIGNLCRKEGDMIGARKNLQKAIKIHRGLGHTDSNPEMATLIHNLGM